MITSKVIADSITKTGVRITTLEAEYPRMVLAELNTHRMLSRNSASSRAIPTASLLAHIRNDPAKPVFWGKNKPGMAVTEELDLDLQEQAVEIWESGCDSAVRTAKGLAGLGTSKQIANRPVEPWMMMKTVVTATEWNNFFYLRAHKEAQQEIQALAYAMLDSMQGSKPQQLKHGEWHLPYVQTSRNSKGDLYYHSNGTLLSLEEAKIISASCCAQVSYRRSDTSLEKARSIYAKLIESTPSHSSPVEHQATPMPERFLGKEYTRAQQWPLGISHQDRDGEYWSGNFKGWIQLRKTLKNEAVWGTVEGK